MSDTTNTDATATFRKEFAGRSRMLRLVWEHQLPLQELPTSRGLVSYEIHFYGSRIGRVYFLPDGRAGHRSHVWTSPFILDMNGANGSPREILKRRVSDAQRRRVALGTPTWRSRYDSIMIALASLGLTPEAQYENHIAHTQQSGIGPETVTTRKVVRQFARLRAVAGDLAASGHPTHGYAANEYWIAHAAIQRLLDGKEV